MVGIRVVEATDEDVIARIVTATNTQNDLSADSMGASSSFHKHLEDFFLAQPEDRRLFYERRIKQYGSGVPRSKVVTRRQLTQAYAAMWLNEPHSVTRYQSLISSHDGVLFHPGDDPLPYYTSAAAQYRLAWLFDRPNGAGIATTYRPARFHLLAGMKFYLFGDDALPKAEKSVEAACQPILDVMWDNAAARDLAEALLPAVRLALEPGDNLAQVVRTGQFTDRFRRAVLDLPRPRRAAA